MAETLVRIDEKGVLQPLLAKDWSVSDDGLTVTFDLRQGVTFQDGTPFDADAVKWNIERTLDTDLKVPQRAPLTPIASVDAVDASTVVLHLSQPAPALVSAMSNTTSAMLSPASVDAEGNSYDNVTHPVGTGPYAFDSRAKGERLVVQRNDAYWGEKPYYDQVVFQIVPEATTRESLLLAGQAEMILLPPAADLPALTNNPRVNVLLAPGDRTVFIAINTTNGVLADKRVRQALNYAVDKQAIIDGVLFGAADELDAPMAPSLFGYSKLGAYAYDPEKAKALLQEAGVAQGTPIDMITPTGRYLQDFQATQAVAGYLRDVGLEPSVRTMDWPSYVATILKPPGENDTQLHLLGWAPSYLDASQQMLQFWSTQSPPNGLATSFYSNPQVDDLIVAASQEVDSSKRADLYHQAAKLVWDDAPWIFLWTQRFPIAYSADIDGVGSIPNEKFSAIYAHPK
jgi:peptide/nickel transport system substrate-binding protein